MAKKKNKKAIAKRNAKSRQKKKQKRKLKVVEAREEMPDFPSAKFDRTPALISGAPEGFYPITINQALMKFAEPIMEKAESDSYDEHSYRLNLGNLIWNYAISLEEGGNFQNMDSELLGFISPAMRCTQEEARQFLDKMVERKKYLFPPEIQPKGSMTLFIRKESHHEISKFDYKNFKILQDPIPPTDQDKELVDKLFELDRQTRHEDYDQWERFYLELENECQLRFYHWLTRKGALQHYEDLDHYAGVFMNFVYRYGHNSIINLRTVEFADLREFFLDHVIRKWLLEPNEYTEIPPSIKLFYNFLNEIGYIDAPEPFVGMVDEIEPEYIEFLQQRYG